MPPSAAEKPASVAGRHDTAERRRLVRRGRERGGWLYITAEALETAGSDPHAPAPYYRTWPGARGRVVIQLYREK